MNSFFVEKYLDQYSYCMPVMHTGTVSEDALKFLNSTFFCGVGCSAGNRLLKSIVYWNCDSNIQLR